MLILLTAYLWAAGAALVYYLVQDEWENSPLDWLTLIFWPITALVVLIVERANSE